MHIVNIYSYTFKKVIFYCINKEYSVILWNHKYCKGEGKKYRPYSIPQRPTQFTCDAFPSVICGEGLIIF